MKDEIKEILDELESMFEISEAPEYIINGFNKIKDCITNLQKENEILKENAIHNDKVVDEAKWNEMLYKSRNEKAREYIKNKQELNKMFGTITLSKDSQNELLNILGGDDNE